MYDVGVEVFQKCLEMSEIAAESRWMLRNVSEIVGSQIKKAVISNVLEHKDIRSFFGYAATRQEKSFTKNSKEVETLCIV